MFEQSTQQHARNWAQNIYWASRLNSFVFFIMKASFRKNTFPLASDFLKTQKKTKMPCQESQRGQKHIPSGSTTSGTGAPYRMDSNRSSGINTPHSTQCLSNVISTVTLIVLFQNAISPFGVYFHQEILYENNCKSESMFGYTQEEKIIERALFLLILTKRETRLGESLLFVPLCLRIPLQQKHYRLAIREDIRSLSPKNSWKFSLRAQETTQGGKK